MAGTCNAQVVVGLDDGGRIIDIPVGVGGDADEAGLVESDRQGDGVSGVDGGDMYTDEGLLIMVYLKRWGVGFGGELPENGLLFQIRFRH